MNRQDDSAGPNGMDAKARAEIMRADRRRAIVKGLGKGAAAAAAVSPLTAWAAPANSRNFVTADGRQCTVSGQQSAAVSTNANTNQVCVCYHPTYFLTVSGPIDLTGATGGGAGSTGAAIGNLRNRNKLVGRVYYAPTSAGVYIKTQQSSNAAINDPASYAGTARMLSRGNWPAPSLLVHARVTDIFPGAGTGIRTIVEQLYRWSLWGSVNGNTPNIGNSAPAPSTVGSSPILTAAGTVGETDLAYFCAAYLTALVPGAVGFNVAYVQAQYADPVKRAAFLAFYKPLAQTGKVIHPLP